MLALPIGEWAGEPVWLVRQTMPRDMGSVRQMLDAEPGLFQWPGGACSLRSSSVRIVIAVIAATGCA
ncbi:hypothetical protein SODG_002993 [Sodalis praecaptivus]